MGGKAKSRCHLGMLKVNKLKHSHLNVMKLENYGPTGECLNNNTKPHKVVFFTITSMSMPQSLCVSKYRDLIKHIGSESLLSLCV